MVSPDESGLPLGALGPIGSAAVNSIGLMSQYVGKHRLVVSIPFALKAFLRVVLLLEAKEVNELRITCLDVAARRPAVVREVIAAAEFDGPVNDAAKVLGSLTLARLCVRDVQIADDAHRLFARP